MWPKLRDFLDLFNRPLTSNLLWLRCKSLNSLINPLSREGLVARLYASNGTLTFLLYNKVADILRLQFHDTSVSWILWFMWLRKKEIFIQIKEYERNTEFLIEFAHYAKKRRVQDITREDVKGFYKERIAPMTSSYYRLEHLKYLNKFFRYYGVPLILGTDEVVEITPNDDIVEAMKTVSIHNPTPKKRRNKRVVELKDRGWSYSEICAEMGLRAKSTVHRIYHREKNRS